MVDHDDTTMDEYELHLADKVRFITRNVTPEEKAATIVVLDKIVEEESVLERGHASGSASLWQKHQRSLRDGVWLSRNFDNDFTD